MPRLGEGGAGQLLWAPRPRHPGLPHRPTRPHAAPASRSRPPSRPKSPQRRPTSQGLATTPAPGAFPGHVARAPAGISRAPPGGGAGGVRARPAVPHGRVAPRAASCGTPTPTGRCFLPRDAPRSFADGHTHARTHAPEGQPRRPVFFIALDTTSGARLLSQTLGHTQRRPGALLGRPVSNPSGGPRGAQRTGPSPRPPSPESLLGSRARARLSSLFLGSQPGRSPAPRP